MSSLPRAAPARGEVTLGVALGVVAIAAAGAFAAGRWTASGVASPARKACSGDGVVPIAFRPGDDLAPPWAPTGKWKIPMVGSIFRSGLSTAQSPLEGVETVLVSPLADECLDNCPLGLRVVGGNAGKTTVAKILPSLVPNLDAVEDAGGLPPGLVQWIREAEAVLGSRADTPGADDRHAPLRALFISMPRPDLGKDIWSVGLAVHDMTDVHFDRGTAAPQGGHRLLISRVSRRAEGGGRSQVLSGALEIGQSAEGHGLRAIPASATELGRAFGSLWGHFGGLPEQVAGLYLSEDGRIFAYGPDLDLRLLPGNPELRRALEALLRRA